MSQPNIIEKHYSPKECSCGCSLQKITSKFKDKRQVFDLPQPKLIITEHQIESKTCPNCGKHNKAKIPVNVNAHTQYGGKVKSLIILLNTHYRIPYKKLKVLFHDLYGYSINESTVYSANKSIYSKLEPSEKIIKSNLLSSSVAHSDETGIRINKALQWLHVVTTNKFTYSTANKYYKITVVPD